MHVVRSRFQSWVVCLFLAGFAQNAVLGQSAPQPAPNRRIQQSYDHSPLMFEPNHGQSDARVQFLTRGTGYSAFLTAGSMVLSLRPSETGSPSPQSKPAKGDGTFSLHLVGAASNPRAVGEDPLPGKVNYFVGKDPSQWRTGIPTFAKVRYKDVYPGIDLVYYGNQGRVEYDFVVAAGADPNRIQFAIQGADELKLEDSGDLAIRKAGSVLRFQSPLIYQEKNGRRIPVSGGYVVQGNESVAFHVSAHDKKIPLVIDPVLVYSTYLGGRSYDNIQALAVDSQGNAIIAGTTSSSDFPLAETGNFNPAVSRVFVAKLDVSGATLLFADYLGSTDGNDWASAVAIDGQDSIYLTGGTYGADFPVVHAFQSALSGADDGYLVKLSADGAALTYSTYLGGTDYDYPNSLAVNSLGEAYLAGKTQSLDFPVVNAGQDSITPDHNMNYGNYGFVSKFAANGASLAFSTYLAGTDVLDACGGFCSPFPSTSINGLVLDGAGNAYVGGATNSNNFPVSESAYLEQQPNSLNFSGNNTGFISKLTSSGAIEYSTYFGGGGVTNITSIAVDETGAAYVTGGADSDGTFPITSTSICNPSSFGTGCGNAFVAKLAPSGESLGYSTFLGHNNSTSGQAIVVDTNHNVFVLAQSSGTSLALVNPMQNYAGSSDVLLMEVDPTGASQLWVTALGGEDADLGTSLVLAGDGALYLAGSTNSSAFPTTQAGFATVAGGNQDGFVAKIAMEDAAAVAISPRLLQFSTRGVGTTSTAKSVVLRNVGTAALTISSKVVSGDFAETDDCGSTVPAAGSCTLNVSFTPTAPGSRFGSITISDDAAGSPHLINLVGDGSAPVASLSSSSLTFVSLPVHSTSSAQSVTLTNTGNATLNISGIAASGDFAQTSNCPSALSIASSCQIQVTFTPSTGGLRTGSLTITDDAAGSSQAVSLTGSGYVTTATISPGSLSFANLAVSSSSSAQTVTITNTGGNTMTVSAVAVSGDFSQTNNCTTLAASGGTCTIQVRFTPTAAGSRSGTLTIQNDAQGNPHSVSLNGTGSSGAVSLSTSSLTFATRMAGSTSSAQTVTLTNTGNAALTVTSLQASGDFAQTNNCATVAASASCAVQVTFTPTSAGSRTGTLVFTDSATDSPQAVSLTGEGIDFRMAAEASSATVNAGQTATYALQVSSSGGTFSNPVNLTCSGLPAYSTCSLSPNSVTPGSSSAGVTVSIHTTGPTAGLVWPQTKAAPTIWAFLSQSIGLLGIVIFGQSKRPGKSRWGILLVLLLAAVLVLAGCGGGLGSTTNPGGGGSSSNRTPAGTYTVIVLGTSGSAQHFTTLTLTVQ
ncbi:MAG: choice-of-anchor D domain-containing protein [Acidobacteria bacterium]|nr:choice-of-anchor D domain-containing protein [Acidobacteriota bacterium]